MITFSLWYTRNPPPTSCLYHIIVKFFVMITSIWILHHMNLPIMIEFIIGPLIQIFLTHIREPTHLLNPLVYFLFECVIYSFNWFMFMEYSKIYQVSLLKWFTNQSSSSYKCGYHKLLYKYFLQFDILKYGT